MRRGCYKSPGVLKGVNYSDPVVMYRGETVLLITKKLMKKNNVGDLLSIDLATDVFYSLYLPYPILKPSSDIPLESERNYFIIDSLMGSKDFLDVRKYSIARKTLSTLVSASLMENIINELQQEGQLSSDSGRSVEANYKSLNNAVRRALRNTVYEAQNLRKLEKLLGRGIEAGEGVRMDLIENGSEVIELARSTDVSELLNYVTLLPEVGRRVRKKYVKFSKGEFRGYELGNTLERVVPTELALPNIYFNIKFIESKLLLYDKVLPKIEGPIYLLTDKSGSMDGEKIKWAKATSIALFTKARKERRDFYLRFFDSSPHTLNVVPRNARTSEITKFIKYISRVAGSGGTDITKAVTTACDDIMESSAKGVADIVLITDGEDTLSEYAIRRKLKKANARLITVMINGENRDLRKLSNAYLRALHLNKEEILKVVEA